jgi:type II secretion system protein H
VAALKSKPVGGLTLIEVMIVLLLIGVTTTFLTVVVEARQRPDAEIDRLALALETAAERARVRGTPIRFELIRQGYRFSRLDTSGNWLPVVDDPLLAERSVPVEMAWRRLTRDGQDTAGGLTFGSDIALYTIEMELPSGRVFLVAQPSGTLRKIVAARPA